MVFRIEEEKVDVCVYTWVCVCVCACRHIHAIYMYVCVCIYKSAVYIGKWAVWWFGSSLWPFSISVRHRRLMETLSNEYAASWLLCVVVYSLFLCLMTFSAPSITFFLTFPPCADNLFLKDASRRLNDFTLLFPGFLFPLIPLHCVLLSISSCTEPLVRSALCKTM